ncbi:PhzF family phenazine biosynthesis isomerase [Nocardioides convexus]|uniref:PhzF family phenazine biosynthesis protein n=1 Tax=Nocardioides convexus TaxID=2712224 RepID=UPI0031014244
MSGTGEARAFRQVDVFTAEPLLGNPVAVVHDADGLSDEQMQAFARWTNLSETTFLLAPEDPAADYRLRIFTTETESAVRRSPHPRFRARVAGGGRRTGGGAAGPGVRRRARRACAVTVAGWRSRRPT